MFPPVRRMRCCRDRRLSVSSQSPLEELVVTNSIPLKPERQACGKIRTLSVAPLLARAIQSIHEGGSVSTLFI